MQPSTLTKLQSTPASRSWRASASSCKRANTPASLHSLNQPQAVEPGHKTLNAGLFHCIPVSKTHRIAPITRRGGVGLRPPPVGCGLCLGGISGSIHSHCSSLIPVSSSALLLVVAFILHATHSAALSSSSLISRIGSKPGSCSRRSKSGCEDGAVFDCIAVGEGAEDFFPKA